MRAINSILETTLTSAIANKKGKFHGKKDIREYGPLLG